MRDTVAEMAARAQEISQEAGSKMASAMKDVINAAAGLAGFAVESARDLVQFMVRRGQMTQEEADRLLREAEAAYAKRKPAASGNGDSPGGVRGEAPRAIEPARKRPEPTVREGVSGAAPVAKEVVKPTAKAPAKQVAKAPAAKAPAAKAPATKAPAAKAPAAKAPAAKAPAKAATKSAPKAAAKVPAKGAAKPAAKGAAKKAKKR